MAGYIPRKIRLDRVGYEDGRRWIVEDDGRRSQDGRELSSIVCRVGPTTGDLEVHDPAIDPPQIDRDATAARIVRAYNHHDDLIGVLGDLMEAVDSLVEGTPELDPAPFNPELLARARTVLAETTQARTAAPGQGQSQG
jgi:hypothetical protein